MIQYNRASSRLISLSAASLAAVFAASTASALTIDATYTGMSAAAQADVNSAIALYESTFTDNITVNIGFSDMSGGLGESGTSYGQVSYAGYLAALLTHATTTDDATAIGQLVANPYSPTANLWVTEANLKALGYDTSGFGSSDDGDIGLNTSICFTNHNSPVSGKYDLFGVACHEIDEVLGTVSAVGDSDGVLTDADLFRYDGSGNRSFTTDTGRHAYFSIDGTTTLDEYNQFDHQAGDWGDWMYQQPQQVQDYALSSGESVNPNVEFRLLDVEGFTRPNPAPEPTPIIALGLGAVALLRRRRRR